MKLYQRDYYLEQLIAFKDTSSIKIVTGIRRCGKSKLLDLMIEYLINSGISKNNILKINFELIEFNSMDYLQLHEYILNHCEKDKKSYLFFDEPHMVMGWEKVINSIKDEIDCDIYITGSNAHMLSSEYSTVLSGRYVEIKMLPLSFKEFISFRDFELISKKNLLGNEEIVCISKDNQYRLDDVFNAYIKYGGMPGIRELELSENVVSLYLDGIYNTVINNDVLQRSNIKDAIYLQDPILLKKLALFLADNNGKEFSYNKIAVAVNENLKDEELQTVGNHKIKDYVNGLLQAFIFYEANRYDIRGKELLKTNGKFYIVDLGIKNYLLGYKNYDLGFALENVVYFELLRRGYSVTIGKVDAMEVDFRAKKGDEILYLQVTETMQMEPTLERELKPFRYIDDNYEKIILTMDQNEFNYNGVKVKNLLKWLVNK